MAGRPERTSVSLGPSEVSGPTPVGAPFLASELAARLFDGVSAFPPEPAIRFSFWTRPMLTFSFELAPSVVARVAEMGAGVECCVNDDEPNFEAFSAHRVGAGVSVRTGERDPHEVTARLGVEPSFVAVAGERRSPHGTRVYESGVWVYAVEVSTEGTLDLNRVVHDLRTRLPPNAGASWGVDEVRINLTVAGAYKAGGFRLDAGTIIDLAALNAPVSFFFSATEV